jgi:hypothetical protein
MWKWYENSHCCYAYLKDVHASPSWDQPSFESQFENSEWFRRGWTLQELLAPRKVIFLNSSWFSVGTRRDSAAMVEKACGIPQNALILRDHSIQLHDTVAARMSWSRDRKTSRKEDEAYCLMGLFSVNMPLLYGEGPAAFRRLCEEILKMSNDDSLLLHGGEDILPDSPTAYEHPSKYVCARYRPSNPRHETSYTMTKGHLYMQHTRVVDIHLTGPMSGIQLQLRYIILNCELEKQESGVLTLGRHGPNKPWIKFVQRDPHAQDYKHAQSPPTLRYLAKIFGPAEINENEFWYLPGHGFALSYFPNDERAELNENESWYLPLLGHGFASSCFPNHEQVRVLKQFQDQLALRP